MSDKKYKLGKKEANGLHKITALKSFGDVEKGEQGGFIEKEENLSHEGNAWVCGDAWVFGDARVFGNAQVFGDARVFGNAQVCGDAWVFGNAQVCGDAWVFGNAWVYGDARVSGRFDVTCKIDFELPRVTLDSTEKAEKLRKFLESFEKEGA
jgi:hypothetical protein